MKKKDKKKFKRQDIKLTNTDISDLDEYLEEDFAPQKQAEKKKLKKGIKSQKSDLKLINGRVYEIYSNYKCLVNFGDKSDICHIGGRLKHLKHETRNIVALGDRVKVDISDENRIEEIIERKNSLVRYSEDSFQKEIIIAANIDNVIIMVSCREPELNLGLVDRFICATRLCNIPPVICINKIDLIKKRKLIQREADYYKKYGIQVLMSSAKTGEGLKELEVILKDMDSVFVGHSGVGKSSLINLLQPGLNLKVAKVNEYTGKGIHTTTKGKIIPWKFGGNLIDTPGIKTLTLHEESKSDIKYVFPGINELSEKCKYPNCSHIHETNCAVKEAVEKSLFDRNRYESYLRIMESFTGVNYE